MRDWLVNVPRIDWALGAALALSALLALATRRRGGHFRALPGWVGFWAVFAGILVSLSHLRPWISLTMLGLLMFAGLRTYFFVAPLRPQDRYALLAAYLAIPAALYVGVLGSALFLSIVPVSLFLLFPVLLSLGAPQEGLLESVGRILLGVLFFVFCAGHLGLLVGSDSFGHLQLFGVLVLSAEFPGRLTGRFRQGGGRTRTASGVAGGVVLAVAAGYWAGPVCGLSQSHGAWAGLFVAIAVTLGALVSEAIMRELAPAPSVGRTGRWAFLDRTIPAVYAAPVFFHYLNYFA